MDALENRPVEIPDGLSCPAEATESRLVAVGQNDDELRDGGHVELTRPFPSGMDHEEIAYPVRSVERGDFGVEYPETIVRQAALHPVPEFIQKRILVTEDAQGRRMSFHSDPEGQSAVKGWTEQEHGLVDISVFGQLCNIGQRFAYCFGPLL